MVQGTQQPAASAAAPDLSVYGVESLWLKQAPAGQRLLVAYAHPDDESFGNAGTILRYTSAGVAVHYACATRGESGTVEPEFLQSYPDVAALRTAELNCAARTLGLSAVHLLGYRDSGMQGSEDNLNPAALYQAPLERVTGQLVALIRAVQPQVVVTFGPYGGYGHPDHIKMHQATVAAFAAAADAKQFPDQIAAGLAPWAPAKLYYSTFGTRLLRFNIAMMRLWRQDPTRLGKNHDIDILRALAENTPRTTMIDSGRFFEQKERAWECHSSQLGGMGSVRSLPRSIRRLFNRAEQFTRVVPPWGGQRTPERDLFAGLDPTAS